MESCKLFLTHHAPLGAWASLTFGAYGMGVSVDLQEPNVEETGALLVGEAVPGQIHTLGFVRQPESSLAAEGDEEKKKQYKNPLEAFGLFGPHQIRRRMSPSREGSQAGRVELTVHTPCGELPDGDQVDIPALLCVPGLLLEVTVDNRDRNVPCTAFFGMMHRDMKQIYAMDQGNGLRTVGYRDQWMFAGRESDGVYLVRGLDAVQSLEQGKRLVHQNGPAFLCLSVEAGRKKTMYLAWSVYAQAGSNGATATSYYYNRYFSSARQAADYILGHREELLLASRKSEEEIGGKYPDSGRFLLFCQAVRAYYACCQLLRDEGGAVRYNICEGAYLWRNTMDLCADHLVWELARNPWVVRNIMDQFIEEYSYTDRVRFPGREGLYEGGISFTHDMGCYFTYSRRGQSAYERSNDSRNGFYFHMTTEELLNGIYCMAGYALKTGDAAWLKRRRDVLEALMTSLENRDDCVPERRNGILKAVSEKSGACGLESTTYDALDHSLLEASGNLYVFVKTWCALLLLSRCFRLCKEDALYERAEKMRNRCRQSIGAFRREGSPILKANAYREEIRGAVIAAVEALAVPHMLHAIPPSGEEEMLDALREHGRACLQEGVCLDAVSGGLRLSSTSKNTWPSKSVLAVYVLEEVLHVEVPRRAVEEIIGWAQDSAKTTTIADQIMSDTREVVGAVYYPRIVTSALWTVMRH